MIQKTLGSMISAQEPLTDDMKDSLFNLLARRAHSKTRSQLRMRIEVPIALWPNYSLFNRVTVEDNGRFSYCAGQDYRYEITKLRTLVLEG